MAVSEPGKLSCPECGAEALPDEAFCENCGAVLGDEPSGTADPPATVPITPTVPIMSGGPARCPGCGGSAFQDGYCTTCGAPAARERDHWPEAPAPWVAAVSDRGVRHHRNEDAMAVRASAEPGSLDVLVVCDGVSSSADPDIASLAAARAARDVLAGPTPSSPSVAGRINHWTTRLHEAAAAANAQAVAVYRNPSGRPRERDSSPSCTLVAGVVDGPVVVVGWIGDSRAYWLPDAGPGEQLSVDDSWASEQILSGVPREEAETSPQAHAITRWLGQDSPDHSPRCSSTTPTGPGWLLLCSDGLWNYCSPADRMGDLVTRIAADSDQDPVRTARALVAWANGQGGMDNITVALARLDAPAAT